jgi:hypothetical protein
MVVSVAECEVVAYLRNVLQMSERRACLPVPCQHCRLSQHRVLIFMCSFLDTFCLTEREMTCHVLCHGCRGL